MLNRARWLMVAIAAVLAIQSNGEGGIRLPDQPPQDSDGRSLNFNEDHGRSVSQIIRDTYLLSFKITF